MHEDVGEGEGSYAGVRDLARTRSDRRTGAGRGSLASATVSGGTDWSRSSGILWRSLMRVHVEGSPRIRHAMNALVQSSSGGPMGNAQGAPLLPCVCKVEPPHALSASGSRSVGRSEGVVFPTGLEAPCPSGCEEGEDVLEVRPSVDCHSRSR